MAEEECDADPKRIGQVLARWRRCSRALRGERGSKVEQFSHKKVGGRILASKGHYLIWSQVVDLSVED